MKWRHIIDLEKAVLFKPGSVPVATFLWNDITLHLVCQVLWHIQSEKWVALNPHSVFSETYEGKSAKKKMYYVGCFTYCGGLEIKCSVSGAKRLMIYHAWK